MNRVLLSSAILIVFMMIALGCSGGNSPVTPVENDLTPGGQVAQSTSNTYLWGFYDVTIDTTTGEITAVPDRTTQFAANVVTFLNGNPAAMSFTMNNMDQSDPSVITVDIDVSLTHPFSGMPQFNGYDVRGVFMGDGTPSMKYNSALRYPAFGTDQAMMANPDNTFGAPDGYTRWFNATEFTVPGVLGYTHGNFAIKNYTPTSRVNPYKYFADGIGKTEDAFDWLLANATGNGEFKSGSTNTRNYYIEFPMPGTMARFAYAVVANWEDADTHPSNAIEAPVARIDITPDLYYVDNTDKGGKIIFDVDIWGWHQQPTAIKVESSVLNVVYTFDAEMTPIGGGDHYSTYHAEIPSDNVMNNSIDGNDGDLWIICEYEGEDYSCDFTPPGGAPPGILAAFFRYPLFIADEPYNADPICELEVVTPMPYEGFLGEIEFDATGSYDPDGDPLTFEWDFNGNGIYDEDPEDSYTGDPDNPTHTYTEDYSGWVNLRLTDGVGGEAICSVEVDVTFMSCLPQACPSQTPTTMIGTHRLYYWPPRPVQVANSRVVAAYSPYAWSTINVTGTTTYDLTYNSPTYSIYATAIDSNDRVYYQDSGSYQQIYYTDYTGSTFSNMRTFFGFIPSGWYVMYLAMDDEDNPIVFARGTSSNQARVFHWDGSSFGNGWDIPSGLWSYAGNSYKNIRDFDYDSTTGYYYITEYYSQLGVYAFDQDGIIWSDDNIWSAISGTAWQIGVFIDFQDPVCHLICMAGYNTSNQTTYWARFNPLGGEKTTGTTSSGTYGTTFSTFDGRGCVQVSGGTARFLAATYGGNVWSSTIVPNW